MEKLTLTDRWGNKRMVDAVDILATRRADGMTAVSAINKDAVQKKLVTLDVPGAKKYRIHTLNGDSTESYNDIGVNGITCIVGEWIPCTDEISVALEPHSINVIEIETE